MCRLFYFTTCSFLFLHLCGGKLYHDYTNIKEKPLNPTPTYYTNAGVVTNSEICTNIALDILEDDGSAVDAAIGALLCEGITNPQSMGIGGGFLMTIYDSATQKVEVLNAREVAPSNAQPNMFANYGYQNDGKEFSMGGLTVAVPGELMGYWEAHKRYGKIAWIDLFRPAIDIATKGVKVLKYTGAMIDKVKDDIYSSITMTNLLTNPETKTFYKTGEKMRRLCLAETLALIGREGPQALYDGPLTEDFLRDIEDNGGIITKDDLKNYKAVWEKPVQHSIGNHIFYSASNPGSGDLLMYILDVMTSNLCNLDVHFWHRIIETWKFVFGMRAGYSGGVMNNHNKPSKINSDIVQEIITSLNDNCTSNNPNDYLRNVSKTAVEDHGTSQICIYARNGDAVSVTSTINLSFGALLVSESTGIILNNQMIDFCIPNNFNCTTTQKVNEIAPQHYPMSTMIPTIVIDPLKGVRLVIGAAGGFKILTSTSIVILQNIFMKIPLTRSISAKRLHHQLKPMVVEFEEGFEERILNQLQKIGHVMQPLDDLDRANSSSSMATFSCVNGISIVDDMIYPVGDPRRLAFGAGF